MNKKLKQNLFYNELFKIPNESLFVLFRVFISSDSVTPRRNEFLDGFFGKG